MSFNFVVAVTDDSDFGAQENKVCHCHCFPTLIFSSSLLSAIRVVSSIYLRLLILLPAIFIPACASPSSAFCMMYSACKLNKQGDNIQPWCTPFPIWNQFVYCSMSGSNCCSLTFSQEAGKVVWYFYLLKNFPVCCDLHSQRL